MKDLSVAAGKDDAGGGDVGRNKGKNWRCNGTRK